MKIHHRAELIQYKSWMNIIQCLFWKMFNWKRLFYWVKFVRIMEISVYQSKLFVFVFLRYCYFLSFFFALIPSGSLTKNNEKYVRVFVVFKFFIVFSMSMQKQNFWPIELVGLLLDETMSISRCYCDKK